jgi:16S rRNA (guanine527-N7)-methyltransferase
MEGPRLTELLAAAGLEPLDPVAAQRLEAYSTLLHRWNARVNLTAIRDQEEILSRHFVESIACARALPAGIGTLLDFGSGAGFPGIPVALLRPGIAVTLCESQGKKAAFLHEAVRVVEVSAEVYRGRAEDLARYFDCVTLRAVDRMADAVKVAGRLVAPHGWLALMTTGSMFESLKVSAGSEFSWSWEVALPGSVDRILVLGERGSGLSG